MRTGDGAREGRTQLPTRPQKRNLTPPLPKMKEDEVVVLEDDDAAVDVGRSEARREGSLEFPVRIDDVPAADVQQPLPRAAQGGRESARAERQGARGREGGRERSRSPHLPRQQGGGRRTSHIDRDTPRNLKGEATGPSQRDSSVDARGSAPLPLASSHASSSPRHTAMPMTAEEEGLISTSSFLRAALAQIAEHTPGARDPHSFYTGKDSQTCSRLCLYIVHELGH